MSDKKATLTFDGKTIEFDSLTGTENETGLDITKLRAETGLITLDPAYGNTGSCTSDITFIDGGKGILRYRGYAIEELCEKSDFLESAFLNPRCRSIEITIDEKIIRRKIRIDNKETSVSEMVNKVLVSISDLNINYLLF